MGDSALWQVVQTVHYLELSNRGMWLESWVRSDGCMNVDNVATILIDFVTMMNYFQVVQKRYVCSLLLFTFCIVVSP